MAPSQDNLVLLKNFITNNPEVVAENATGKIEESLSDAENRILDLYERKQLIDLRFRWSHVFVVLVLGILIFEVIITILVGCDILNFEDEWFLRLIILGGFTQILTMPYLLTKFLFNINSKVSSGNR